MTTNISNGSGVASSQEQIIIIAIVLFVAIMVILIGYLYFSRREGRRDSILRQQMIQLNYETIISK